MFEIKLIFYDLSCMLQFSQFVWTLSYSVFVVFNNFLLIDETDRSKISSDQKRFFIALSLYPFSIFANTSFKSPFINGHIQLTTVSSCCIIMRKSQVTALDKTCTYCMHDSHTFLKSGIFIFEIYIGLLSLMIL